MNLLKLFCDVDDFCKDFELQFNRLLVEGSEASRRKRKFKMSLSEVMTILIWFHSSNYRTFKHFYIHYVCKYMRKEFPQRVSYNRFVELMSSALIPLCVFLNTRKGKRTGIAFIDSCPIKVCHNKRIHFHKVFQKDAERGKTSMGWFYGFKLHLIINDCGELLAFKLTPGNIDDRKPLPDMCRRLWGKLFGDKGYICHKLFEKLWKQGVQLITRIKKNMKNKLLPIFDKLLLRKRALIESVNDQLKNISQIEHTRHRSCYNFMTNLISGLIAYSYRDKKPSLNLRNADLKLIQEL